jgi:imidazolonepropionase-like amidohydrolase
MITTAPARALGYESKLGTLQTGSCADWVGWRIPTAQDPIPLILQGMDPAQISCVAGKITVYEKI